MVLDSASKKPGQIISIGPHWPGDLCPDPHLLSLGGTSFLEPCAFQDIANLELFHSES